MSKVVEAFKEAVSQGGRLQLPATSKLLARTALDDEEEAGKAEVSFLNAQPKKRKRELLDEVQGNWSALESTLKRDDPSLFAIRASSQPRAETDSREWHEIPVARMTPELENDLRIIENRQHLDPKRFYKSSGSGRKKGELPTRVQIGTVVVGAHEFYSSRLTRKERRGSIMDEVLSDGRTVDYAKSRFNSLQVAKQINKRIIDPAARRKRKSSDW